MDALPGHPGEPELESGGNEMKLLKPGDPCPCCGRPIKDGLPEDVMLALSQIAHYRRALERTQNWEDESLAE